MARLLALVVLVALCYSTFAFDAGKGYGLSARYKKQLAASPPTKNYGPSSGYRKGVDTAPKVNYVPAPPPPVAEKAATPAVAMKVTPPIIAASPTAQEAKPPVDAAEEPKPKISLEAQLKQQILEESISREKRKTELNSLESQLASSLKKQMEVEAMISKELNALRPRIIEEMARESARLSSLEGLAKSFKDGLQVKIEAAASEEIILGQMTEVRQRIKEQIIIDQLEVAIKKKIDLLSIERGICRDIATCIDNLENEIGDSKSKVASLQNVFAKMPTGADVNSNRQYTWADISSLQSELASSLDSAVRRDEKVKVFIKTFDDAMRRRGLALGEQFSSEVETAPKSPPFPSFSSFNSKVTAPAKKIATVASKAVDVPTIAQLSDVLKDKSYEDLGKTSTRALTKVGESFVQASLGFVDASSVFMKTTEAEEARISLTLAGESTGSLFDKLRLALDTIGKEWESAVNENPINDGSVDEYVARLMKGYAAITRSKALKETLSEAGQSAKRIVSEASTAASITSSSLGDKLSADNKFSAAAKAFSENFSLLLSVGLVVTKRAYNDNISRQLPDQISKK